jgi:hypothetical protein
MVETVAQVAVRNDRRRFQNVVVIVVVVIALNSAKRTQFAECVWLLLHVRVVREFVLLRA